MQILDTQKRKNMIPEIEAAHVGAMKRLRAAYSSKESLEKLDLIDQKVKVEFSEAMGTCAGRALMRGTRSFGQGWKYEQFGIKLNARLLALNPNELVPTYLHELAHLVANAIASRCVGHGTLWKAVMFSLGLPADRCHNMDTSAFERPVKKFDYYCMDCGEDFALTKVRHSKQQAALANGTWAYRCKCKGRIVHNP